MRWTKKSVRGVVAAAVLASGGLGLALAQEEKEAKQQPARAAVESHIMVTPKEMKWTDAPQSLPRGAQVAMVEGDPDREGELVTFRLRMPANYRIPPHWHPADEHVTVISGTFFMGSGDTLDPRGAEALPAGSFVVMPAKSHHFAFTRSQAEVQIHAVGPWRIHYLDPADDPRKARAGTRAPGETQ